MAKLTAAQIAEVKGKGFLINRGTQNFSGRIVARGTVYSAQDMKIITEIAEKFGNGKMIFTTRLCVEVQGIPYEHIQDAIDLAAANDLHFGGTGAKIRPITACKGTTCVYGNYDTQKLAADLYEEYYLGWTDVVLPHKFKICVGGCPNSCLKPSLNDFGIEGHRVPVYDSEQCRGCKVCQVEKKCPSKAAKLIDGKMHIDEEICRSCGVCTGVCPFKAVAHESEVLYQIYVGGTWGKTSRMSTPLNRLVKEDEIRPILEKTMLWFKENAYKKERLGSAMDRVGVDKFEEAIFSDDLLKRKDEIIAKEVMVRE